MTKTTEWIRARLDELKPELDAKRREMAVLTKECDALQTALTALAGPSKPPKRRPAVNGYTHRDYPAIAEWVIARFAEGSYTSQAAAAEFGTNPGNWYSTSLQLVGSCLSSILWTTGCSPWALIRGRTQLGMSASSKS